jgi:translation initiation factor IF-2
MAVKRLSKVAREMNVGISTIVEFLGSHGVEISTNPNTKIEPAVYEQLLGEFQKSKSVKEKVDEVRTEKEEQKEIVAKKKQAEKEAQEQEEVSNKEEEPKEATGLKVLGKIELPNTKSKKEPKKEVEEQKEEAKTDTIKADSDKLSGPSVVGKIDLPKKPTKKTTKKEEPKAKEKAKEPTEEKAKGPVKEEAAKKEEVETIRATSEKLTAPTVLGKIVLPVDKAKEKKKEKLAAIEEAKQRRKRKRIKKVNVEQAGKKATQQHRSKKKSEPKPEITDKQIQQEIKDTLARLSNKGKNKGAKFRKDKRNAKSVQREEELKKAEEEQGTLKLTEFVTVSELASMMNQQATQIIGTLMSIGIFASINQRLDAETLTMVAEEYGYDVEFVSAEVSDSIEEVEDDPESLESRPPIVTVMGHVDHGKTSLLDFVRKTAVIDGEAGGITQHIGAYSVTGESGRKVTFLDTPGHEAFTAMRARGAQVTDIAIIIIAADDDVMPQTKEAINHAQAAGVPMVFALNKIDKDGANPDKVREQLSQMNILLEEWGGKFQSQEISAKKGTGVEELIEKVLLEAELLELKANPNKNAVGTVIEATLDKGRGFVTTLLIEAGTLKVGDVLIAGTQHGRVKVMHDEHGKEVEEAKPSKPVSVLGMNGAAAAGDRFHVMDDEKEVKNIASKRQQLQREQGLRTTKHITLDEIGRRLALGDFKELNIIVKGDVDGSIEALSDSLLKLSQDEIQVNVIHKAVGQITESDVLLASASDAIIIGFQVRPSMQARKLAEAEEIDIRLYSVIYKAIEEVKEAMEGMLSPEIKEEIVGTAEVREAFEISKVGTIAGCFVMEGKLMRNEKIRLIRDGIVIYTGNLGSLKRFKDDVKEVARGYECGLNIEKHNDIKVGDQIECYIEKEVARKLNK